MSPASSTGWWPTTGGAPAAAPNDRRSFLVRLTPKGQAQFAAVARAHEQWMDRMLSDFDGDEAETIIRYLDGLAGRIRNGGSTAVSMKEFQPQHFVRRMEVASRHRLQPAGAQKPSGRRCEKFREPRHEIRPSSLDRPRMSIPSRATIFRPSSSGRTSCSIGRSSSTPSGSMSASN